MNKDKYPTEIWVPLRVHWCGNTDRDSDEVDLPYDPGDPYAVYDGTRPYNAYGSKPKKYTTHLFELSMAHAKFGETIEIEGTEEDLIKFFNEMKAQALRAGVGVVRYPSYGQPGSTATQPQMTYRPIYQEPTESITDILKDAKKKGSGEELTPLQETLSEVLEGLFKTVGKR